MAKNRKNQTVSVRFGPPLKAAFLLLFIGAAALGYVWQKSMINQLAREQVTREARLKQLFAENDRLAGEIANLHQPVQLDQRARELNLGLTPAQPGQVVRLVENVVGPGTNRGRTLAARATDGWSTEP